MAFRFERLRIPEVILVEGRAFEDSRGYFMETYKRSEFEKNGIPWEFVQDNRSRSSMGVLRGLHYQLDPKAQGKLVIVVRGGIYDVAVDIRRGSPTYGEWISIELSEEDPHLLYIPVGFAHGFQALENGTDVIYKVTSEYAPEADRGICWNDPDLSIPWPIEHAILSEKDTGLPRLADAESRFPYESGHQ